MDVESSEAERSSLPFVVAFNQAWRGRRLLAIGDEDGYITVLDPKSPLPRSTKMLSGDPRAQSFRWVAHNNAIFDLKWSRDNHRILTASGDQTIMLWSTARAEPLGCFCSHRGSVKSVALQPMHDEVFASGSRDGRLAVWDTRVLASQIPGQDIPLYQPIVSVQDAHLQVKRSRSRSKGRLSGARNDSVTSVVWLSDGQTLASAGAGDSVIKIWDLRQMKRPKSEVAASAENRYELKMAADCPAPNYSKRPHGITCLVVHEGSNRMLASCSDNCHYLFDALRPDQGAITSFGGHQTRSFYVKADFSPCGTHFVSGSSNKNLHIWQVERPQDGAYSFEGHGGEVTGVSWCPEDFFQVASCADDSCVRLWSVARGKDGPAVPRRLVALPSAPAASSDSTYPSAPRLDGLPAVARRPLVPVGNLPSPPSPLGLVGRKSPGGTGIAPQARVAPAASGFSPAGSTESGASGAFSSSRWLARNSTPLLRLDGSPAKGGTPGSQPKPLRLGYEDIRPRNLVQATLPDFLLPTTPVAKPLAAPREPGQLSISQFLAARPDKKRQQGSRASIRGQQAKRNKP